MAPFMAIPNAGPLGLALPFPARAALARLQMALETEQRPSWVGLLRGTIALQEAEDSSTSAAGKDHANGERSSSDPQASSDQGQELRPSAAFLKGAVVSGYVWAYARDSAGCRLVQQAIDEARTEEAREALALELRGHVWEAARCPHANYVVQKCIVRLRPEASQFIVDELAARPGMAAQAARHKYGCRIMQRLLEHCGATLTAVLIEDVLGDILQMAQHPYGNYVIQQILQHGLAEQRGRVGRVLEHDVTTVVMDTYGCAVVYKALCHAPAPERMALARSLLREPGVMVGMSCTRHGHLATKQLLQVLEGEERAQAHQQLSKCTGSLRASRYGRQVAAALQPGRGVDGRRRGHMD